MFRMHTRPSQMSSNAVLQELWSKTKIDEARGIIDVTRLFEVPRTTHLTAVNKVSNCVF
ncbi:hypothetical protein ALO65_200009 [Pseudomonas syringae pv. papulans]|nr:hypothetical protein ALO65_200009 [Pseudomonas syringae pv. papulans]